MATSRFSFASRARCTSPMPPAPIGARYSYGPSLSPIESGMCLDPAKCSRLQGASRMYYATRKLLGQRDDPEVGVSRTFRRIFRSRRRRRNSRLSLRGDGKRTVEGRRIQASFGNLATGARAGVTPSD
jgi:hypothetical protein